MAVLVKKEVLQNDLSKWIREQAELAKQGKPVLYTWINELWSQADMSVDKAVQLGMQQAEQVLGKVNQANGRASHYISAEEAQKACKKGQLAGAAIKGSYIRVFNLQQYAPVDGPPPLITDQKALPQDWQPRLTVQDGSIDSSGTFMTVSDEQNKPYHRVDDKFIKMALRAVYERVFVNRMEGHEYSIGAPMPFFVGNSRLSEGTLRVGTFTDPKSGHIYDVADWQDKNNQNYTFYYQRISSTDRFPHWQLAIEQKKG